MITKHTPGPWKLEDADCVGGFVTGDEGACVVHNWTNKEHSENPSEYDGPASEGEILANARLIAAAPDMLEALLFIESNSVEGGAFNKTARAAIAKATKGTA